MSRRPPRARRNPDPEPMSLGEYVEGEVVEVLKALGFSLAEEQGSWLVALPTGGNFFIETKRRLPGYDNGWAIYIRALAEYADGVSGNDWRDVALPALERAAEVTGNVVSAGYNVHGWRASRAVIIPSWFPKQSVVKAGFSDKRKTAASVMSENRFRVPQEYRKQIGALLQQAAATNDLGTYLQAKELAAMVAE